MSDRNLALAYAAIESRNWASAGEYAGRAMADGSRPARELLALVRYRESRFPLAIDLLEQARSSGEMTADGAARLIRLHLLAGDRRKGWELLGECCRHNVFGPPLYSVPRWEGQPLEGKRVVVWGAGLGDEIFFVRYLPRLCDHGAQVYLNVRPPLVDLFRTLRGNAIVLPFDEEAPDPHYQMNTAELPVFFGAMDGIAWPELGPYFHCAPVDLAASGLRVGIAWAADSRHLEADDRTAALADMRCLAHVPGVTLFNLQVGRFSAQLSPPPAGMRVLPLSIGFPTFAEQASQILALDLVITVDTAIANLAGALGAPAWVALPRIPDWRWCLDGDTTDWYPSARVYRQTSQGDWGGVFDAMAQDLAAGKLAKVRAAR